MSKIFTVFRKTALRTQEIQKFPPAGCKNPARYAILNIENMAWRQKYEAAQIGAFFPDYYDRICGGGIFPAARGARGRGAAYSAPQKKSSAGSAPPIDAGFAS